MNFLKRNVALDAQESYKFWDISLFESVSNIFKWEVCALLTTSEVKDWYYYSTSKWKIRLEQEPWINHDFSMISNKNSIIKNNISRIKYDIIFNWKTENEIDLEICRSYIKMWLISKDEITMWVSTSFNIKAREAINKIQKDWISKDDLNIWDLYFLSYWLKTNTFSMWEKMILERILEKIWIELNHITWMWKYYDFFQERVKYLSNAKNQK